MNFIQFFFFFLVTRFFNANYLKSAHITIRLMVGMRVHGEPNLFHFTSAASWHYVYNCGKKFSEIHVQIASVALIFYNLI